MLVRYFAAARAATGMDEEPLLHSAPITFAELFDQLTALHPISASGHTPPLAELLGRCSFLRNEVAVRGSETELQPDDVVDVLPPFAGG
ncbi:MoaD/ThiS family protein [Paenarthrobacter sp. Z7-10]|uniref:MoaD/ThiS family protein n=1 Tax=Paenarthrobacter sp. Z7-10 TaxID=2787635 RepID=UPI0022A9D41E|nr:MoaD/ThiS family protein [Paenarthrobacter sp. Z7-10]MCZ2403598.1 MoaD/ThiS family protein [Paenarthrobacter sp. Z7-10]